MVSVEKLQKGLTGILNTLDYDAELFNKFVNQYSKYERYDKDYEILRRYSKIMIYWQDRLNGSW